MNSSSVRLLTQRVKPYGRPVAMSYATIVTALQQIQCHNLRRPSVTLRKLPRLLRTI